MADSEFEEFRLHFDQLPQHIRASSKCYTLAHDITPCEELPNFESLFSSFGTTDKPLNVIRESMTVEESTSISNAAALLDVQEPTVDTNKPPQRKRRKLPEIPKTPSKLDLKKIASLADELSQLEIGGAASISLIPSDCKHRPPFFKAHLQYTEEESPGDSDIWPGTDGDSGRDSTAHSPDIIRTGTETASSTPSGDSLAALTELEATHRGLHKFTGRHSDEIDIDIGDPVYVQHEADDCWCDGINLRTRRRGIFPSAYVVDVDYDFDPDGKRVNKERYILHFLGTVETLAHKGDQVICAAVERARQITVPPETQPACILEISDHGLHIMDKSKTNQADGFPCHDYFFALKNVTFCGFHPTDQQYLGFITKHPSEERFACHVFQGNGSTRHVAEAIGRAFQRFCRKFIELAYPIHEFYME